MRAAGLDAHARGRQDVAADARRDADGGGAHVEEVAAREGDEPAEIQDVPADGEEALDVAGQPRLDRVEEDDAEEVGAGAGIDEGAAAWRVVCGVVVGQSTVSRARAHTRRMMA